jgi:hypothetical protein
MKLNKLMALRRQLEQTPRNRRGRLYDKNLRREVCAYAGPHLAEGTSLMSVARALGMEAATLGYWMKARRATQRSMRPVEIVEEPVVPRSSDKPKETREAVVVLPSGVRIEGLKMNELIELARRLS